MSTGTDCYTSELKPTVTATKKNCGTRRLQFLGNNIHAPAAPVGRRNVTEEQKSYLRGKRYRHERKKVTNETGTNQHVEVVGQNAPQPRTSAKLALEFNVNEATIRRDAKYSEAIDNLAAYFGLELQPKGTKTTTTKKRK